MSKVVVKQPIELREDDLKEIFALYTSCSRYEYDEVFDEASSNYYLRENLRDEYELGGDKGDYALDSWRSALLFLSRRGYSLMRGDEIIDLSNAAEQLLIETGYKWGGE